MLSSLFIYSSIFIMTSILSELSTRLRSISIMDKIFKFFFIICILSIPAFFAGIRYGIGIDYFNYVRIFNNANAGVSSRIEFGYNFINFIIGSVGGNVHVLFYLVNFMTILFIYLFLVNYKDRLSVGLGMFVFLLLYYNTSLNIVRQVLAISIVLNSFTFIKKKSFIRFLLTVISATFFHRSAIVVLPFYYLYNNLANKNDFLKIIIYGGVFLTLFNYQQIVEFISLNILNNSYYLHFASSEEIDMGIGLFIVFAPSILLGSMYYKKFSAINNNFKLYYFLLIIGFILRLLPYFGASFLERIADYFLVVQVWLVPFYYRNLNVKKNTFVFANLLVGFYIVYWFYIVVFQGGAGTVPYVSIFNI